METTSSFGYWIRRQRKALDLTQQMLAEQVGCSLAAIKKIEGDERRPSRQIAERLADILRVPTSQREIFLEAARGLRPVDQLSLAREPSVSPGAGKKQELPHHNLPVQLTSFIGRERELAEAKQLLASTRLLTLIGPGGTGKTRLSLQIAQDVLPSFMYGVWLVELAPLADPSLIPQTIASVFELREAPTVALIDILTNYLRAKQLLLILDNCEHLIEACAQLSADLLHVCPQLKIIVSSREALGISGETIYRVPSLSLPNPTQITPETLLESEAGQLFVERAVAVQSHFALQDSNASAASQICHRLDGIPLALELAAARVAVFSTEEIASRLDDRFRLLTGGSRTALERHQTLRALIDWSYDLLSDEERRLFRRLSVFCGGWTFEAAEAIWADLDVLNLLPQLVNKSMVMVDENGKGTRYRLPETIRQYAREELFESGQPEQARNRHLEYFLQFAEEAEPKLRGPEQLEWLERVETEHDNLRTALAWSLESSKSDHALQLAGALYYFWLLRGYISEGQKWLNEALALAELNQGTKGATGKYTPAQSEIAHRARALYGAGWFQLTAMNLQRAHTLVEESLHLWRELGDTWWMAVTLELAALIVGVEGDTQTSLAYLEEGVSLAREIEDPWPLAVCLIRFGDALKPRGDTAAAHPFLEEGVAVARTVGDKIVLSEGLRELGSLYIAEGDLTKAASLTEEALADARETGSMIHIFLALWQLVIISCLQNDLAKAKGYCFELWALSKEWGIQLAAWFALLAFGLAANFSGEVAKSVHLVAASDMMLRQRGVIFFSGTAGDPVSMVYKQALEKAQAQLGPAAFEAAWAEGQQMTLEQALALATGNESNPSPSFNSGEE